MSFLVDAYSGGTDAELRLPGCVGSSEYLSHTAGKNLTAAMVKHVHGLGKLVQLNFEDTATNARGGFFQGQKDAEFVLGCLHTLGAPKGVAVYFSVDFEVHSGQPTMVSVKDYFRAVAATLRPAGFLVGVYGDADVLAAVRAAGLSDFGWQTSSWSYGRRDPHAVEIQDVYTPAYDKDEILSPYIGAWTPTGAQPKPETEFTVDAAATARFDKLDAEIADLKKLLGDIFRDDAGHQMRAETIVREAALPTPPVPSPPKPAA